MPEEISTELMEAVMTADETLDTAEYAPSAPEPADAGSAADPGPPVAVLQVGEPPSLSGSALPTAGVSPEPPVGLLSVGLLILLWSASTLYTVIIDSMNRIAGVKEHRSYIKIRLVAVLMTVVESTILVGSLVFLGVKKVKRVKAPERTISTSKDTVAYLKANAKRG